MSICIISDCMFAKAIFHYNPQYIDQIKPIGEGGLQSPMFMP